MDNRYTLSHPKPGQRRPRYNGLIPAGIGSFNMDYSGMIGWFFDGTGKDREHGSIIAQLYDSYSADLGPALHKKYVTLSFLGWRVNRKIEDAAKQIVSAYQILTRTNGPMIGRPGIAKVGLDLFGYSRGAVMALEVAHALDKCSIPVRFLAMLDPVSNGEFSSRHCRQHGRRHRNEHTRGRHVYFVDFRGRLRGRRVDCSPKRFAVFSTQSALPNGAPRFTHRRTASNSSAFKV